MNFKEYVEGIVQKEVLDIVNQQGYFFETELCTMICKKYKFSMSTVQGTLRKNYPAMDLLKRHATNEIKQFYDLQIKGCPIMYLTNKK